jgi:hypothetical protein
MNCDEAGWAGARIGERTIVVEREGAALWPRAETLLERFLV